jgi:hypothetical protein
MMTKPGLRDHQVRENAMPSDDYEYDNDNDNKPVPTPSLKIRNTHPRSWTRRRHPHHQR